MSELNKNLRDIFLTTNYGAHGISLSKKIKNGQKTEELSITFDVLKKKDIIDLNEEEKIPSEITIDGVVYKTDVVELAPFKAMTCYNPSGDPLSAEITQTRTIQATNGNITQTMRGGKEIIMYPDLYTGSYYTAASPDDGIVSGDIYAAKGTLGFLAIDNEDNKVIGVTNAHVACPVLRQNNDRDLASEVNDPYNLVDSRSHTHNSNTFNGISQLLLFSRETTTDQYSIQRIHHNTATPQIKRVSNFDQDANNTVDAAILAIDDYLFDADSYRIYQPSDTTEITSYFEFATTNELDNLITTPPSSVYSVGRTTGPKGWGSTSSCQLEIDAIDVTTNVGFEERGQSISVGFTDLIRYKYVDNSNFPVAPGDSGSALIADMDGNGTYKIIGLVFAGNSGQVSNPNVGTHIGLACRIDNIASIMNIRAWTSSETPDFSQSTITQEVVDFETDLNPGELSRTINTATYWNAGLRLKT